MIVCIAVSVRMVSRRSYEYLLSKTYTFLVFFVLNKMIVKIIHYKHFYVEFIYQFIQIENELSRSSTKFQTFRPKASYLLI